MIYKTYKSFNEKNLGIDLLDYDYSYDIKGYFIYAKGADRNNEGEGYLVQPGHYSFAGAYQDPLQATLYDTKEKAQEYIDKLEQKVYDVKFIPASDILTSLFQVNKGPSNNYNYFPLIIRAMVIEKTKAKEKLKGRIYQPDQGEARYYQESIESYNGPTFDTFDKAKDFVINYIEDEIKKRQENLDKIKKLTIFDVSKEDRYFKSHK